MVENYRFRHMHNRRLKIVEPDTDRKRHVQHLIMKTQSPWLAFLLGKRGKMQSYRRARKLRIRGPIDPVPAVCATADAARGERRLSSGQTQAILASDGRLLGECRMKRDQK